MTQLELIAIAHALPKDATGITITGGESSTVFFTSAQAKEHATGYSESKRPHVRLDISPFRIRDDRWAVRATVEGDKTS